MPQLEFRAIRELVVTQWQRKFWPMQLAIVTVVLLWLTCMVGFVIALFAGESPPTRTTVMALIIVGLAIGVVFIKRGQQRERQLVMLVLVGSGMSLMNDIESMAYGSEPTPLAIAIELAVDGVRADGSSLRPALSGVRSIEPKSKRADMRMTLGGERFLHMVRVRLDHKQVISGSGVRLAFALFPPFDGIQA